MDEYEVMLGWDCDSCKMHWVFDANKLSDYSFCWKCGKKQKLVTYGLTGILDGKGNDVLTFIDVEIIRR